MTPPPIAYLVSRYPRVSHTFILREVAELRRRGIRVDTFAVRASAPEDALSAADREALATTTALLPLRPRDLLGAVVDVARHPGAAARVARYACSRAAGWRAQLWQLFYTAEAMLLRRHLRRRGIRHVHVHFANVASDVARLACRYGNAVDGGGWTWSFTMHGPTEFFDVTTHDLAGKVADASMVVCISEFCRSQLRAIADGSAPDHFRIVHCGVDPEAFPLLHRPPLHGRPGRILCVGQLVARKGQDVLLDAFARLVASGCDVELVLAGDGAERAALERRAAELGVADRTTFTGAVGQDDILALYAEADLFCLPSFAEGVPVVLMEAMATGLPCVSTRTNGIPELVVDGSTGRLVTPGSVEELAGVLAELLGDEDQRARLGTAGRDRVLEHFTIGAAGHDLVAAFAAFTTR